MNQTQIKGDWRAYLRDSWRNIPGEVTASGVVDPMDDPLLDLLRPTTDCRVIPGGTAVPTRSNRISRRKRS